MNIFLSYASPYRDLADDLCCRLQAVGHEVFFDREDLPAGTSFDDRIRQAIDDAELFIFLVAPEAVAQGHYTRTELKLAARKWPTPGWHVLPVMAADTPLADVPAYLRALTLLQPEGNLTAEVVMEVEDRVRQHGDAAPAPEMPAKRDRAAVRYRSLQLRFAGDGAGGYALSVPESPAGALADAAITLNPAVLEQSLWANARPIAGSARRAGPADAEPALLPGDAAARQIGQTLYTALFGSSAGSGLTDSLRGIDPQRGDGLRFVINTTEAPELARLPWEFLYSPTQDDFLFSDRLKPVVRWLDVDAPPPTLAVAPPLRMLMAIAAPADRPELAIGEELAHLDRALEELSNSGVLTTVRLEHATLETLDNALLEHRPHVLHFIGHGDFVGDDGVLLLESDRNPGTADTIAGRQLAVLLRNYRDCLRLVFLNSCMGATTSTRDPFGGVAQSLIRRGIPAVIAMQFPIPDDAAVELSRHFYRYLAAGQPVDAALSSARAFLFARGYPVEWGAPALHMRTPDGRLFDLAPPPQAAPMAPPAPGAPIATPPSTGSAAEAAPDQPPRAQGRRWGWLIVAAGLAVAAATTLYVFVGDTVRDQAGDMAPELSGGQRPSPAPKPAPVAPSPQARIDAIVRDLESDRHAAALESIQSIVDGDDAAARDRLFGESLGRVRAALNAAQAKATAAGNTELAAALAKAQSQLAPRDDAGAEPPPEPAPVVAPDAVAVAIAALSAGDTQSGLTQLRALLAADPDALSAQVIGEQSDALIQALANVGVNAATTGDTDTLQAAIALLERIQPGIDWATYIAAAGSAAGLEPAAGEAGPRIFYTVRRGDTLWSIARRLLGTGNAWPSLLARHNKLASIGVGGDFIAHPDRIKPGWRINPPIAYDEIGRDRLEYHVIPGDTLSGIAWRVYGDASRWPQIATDNAARIADPDRIRPGQVLVIQPPHDRR